MTVAVLLGALAFAVPARADAQTVQNYSCADSQQSGAASASLSLTDPPTTVTAGQSLSLQAHLTLTLPQSFGLTATASLVSQVGLSTTTFGLQVQIGDTVKVVPAAIVIGQLQSLTVGGSEEASAALTLPAVSVPSTATGDVVVSMPTAAQYPNSATSTPTAVVFNGVLEEQTYLGTPTSVNLACYDPSTSPAPAAQVVAQIPIQAANATAKTTTPTKTTTSTRPTTTTKATKPKATKSKATKSTQTTHHAAGSTPAGVPTAGSAAATSQVATGVPAVGTPAASSAQGASGGAAPSTAGASSPTSASSSSGAVAPAATGTPTNVTIPPRTVGAGTFIPTWELILMGSVLPIAALWYAWYMRRKLAAARSEQLRRSQPLDPDTSAPPEAELVSAQPTQSFTTRESHTRT